MYKKIITKKSTNLSVMFNFSKTIEGMERYSKYLNDQKENWNTVKLVLHKETMPIIDKWLPRQFYLFKERNILVPI